MSILVVVESPAKIGKISKFLGPKYRVEASMGHFRDLDPKSMSIDFNNNFEPKYVITKPDVLKKLKAAMKGVSMLFVASDMDLEGTAIGKSLVDELKPKKYKRLIFNEITKEAILSSVKNATILNPNEINAQKTRRVLDRLYGYLISPILSKQIKPGLSAGRVQSPAVELVVEKENEIKNFLEKNSNSSNFKATGVFSSIRAQLFEAKVIVIGEEAFEGKRALIPLIDSSNPNIKAIAFMKRCLKSIFVVHSIENKIATRSPSPPFTTSTLQQEANRKFSLPIDLTMSIAQKLYEGGYITYMRTDSLEISKEAHANIKAVIIDSFGKEFYHKNTYTNKNVSAQLAHEAIRPTDSSVLDIESEVSDQNQIKLYKLIWQRTISSQMSQAKINQTYLQISISKYLEENINPFYYFQSIIEKIIFLGFMKVYTESSDEEEPLDSVTNFHGKIPTKGTVLNMEEIICKQEFLRPPTRYTQASLVKKIESLGIGRPSTFANTIKTIIDRSYVKIGNVDGIEKNIFIYKIHSENNVHIMQVDVFEEKIHLGKETKKIIPTPIGIAVNEFLLKNFPQMMDYKFTAKIESELDKISEGKEIWHDVVGKFYSELKPIVDELSTTIAPKKNEKELGVDPEGNKIFVSKNVRGPYIRVETDENKSFYRNIPDEIKLEEITLEQALDIINSNPYPKIIGKFENEDIIIKNGPHGPYIQHKKEYYSIPPETDITLENSIEIIKKSKASTFNIDLNGKKAKAIILNGIHGPYIRVTIGKQKKNYPIPKGIDPQTLKKKDVQEIVSKKKR